MRSLLSAPSLCIATACLIIGSYFIGASMACMDAVPEINAAPAFAIVGVHSIYTSQTEGKYVAARLISTGISSRNTISEIHFTHGLTTGVPTGTRCPSGTRMPWKNPSS